MAVTFNGITKQIIATGYADYAVVDVEKELYSAWKRWTVLTNNAKYLQAFRPIGGDATGGTQTAPPYFFLMNNWKILVDGIVGLGFNTNLYCEEASNTNTNPFIVINNGSVISKTSDAPVNTIEVSTIAYSLELGGKVYLDVTDGSDTGTHLGTIANPVKTLTKALAICGSENISSVYLAGTLTLDQDVSGKEFVSWKNGKIDLNNQYCLAARFRELKIWGQQDSFAMFYDCRFSNITSILGIFKRCEFLYHPDIIPVQSGDTHIEDSYFKHGRTVLDVGNGNTTIHLHGIRGQLSFINSTDADNEIAIDGEMASVVMQASCTAGVLKLSKFLKVVNNSTMTIANDMIAAKQVTVEAMPTAVLDEIA